MYFFVCLVLLFIQIVHN